jgi:hypothetical protein
LRIWSTPAIILENRSSPEMELPEKEFLEWVAMEALKESEDGRQG